RPHWEKAYNKDTGNVGLDLYDLGESKPIAPDNDLRGGGCTIVPFEITSNANAYNADVFYYNFHNPNQNFLARTIILNDGDSVYAGFSATNGVAFALNHNGYITYDNGDTHEWYMEDSAYNLIKIFQMGNGYFADEHDFQIFPNGYCLMIGLDTIPDQDL